LSLGSLALSASFLSPSQRPAAATEVNLTGLPLKPIEQSAAPRALVHRPVARAFTLIELLAVIAIIAVLALVVFAFGQSALRSAASAGASSNLRQTGAIISSYAAENNNRLPPSADWGAIMFGGSARFFQRTLSEFAGFPWNTNTPTAPLGDIFYDPVLKGKRQHPWGGFAVNTSIVLNTWDCRRFGHEDGLPIAAIPNPSAKVIYCSAIEPGWDSSWLLVGDDFARQGWRTNTGPDARYNGLAAGLFADGHVEKLDVKNMDEAKRRRLFTLDP
jgi:prepilin-type N-terminal cleavage/methylation domain-containing protein/prepilin-type processing-associated H-X9-DG protein